MSQQMRPVGGFASMTEPRSTQASAPYGETWLTDQAFLRACDSTCSNLCSCFTSVLLTSTAKEASLCSSARFWTLAP